jgi:tRNA(fMet)-specific endonuclease VapC
MKYIFDTNICIYILNNRYESIFNRIEATGIDQIGITSITVAELAFGIENSRRQEENRIALMEFLLPFEILDFSQAEAYTYGKIRAYLQQRGLIIGNMDLLIGSIALARNITLVTNNVSEFNRIDGLRVENWIDKP